MRQGNQFRKLTWLGRQYWLLFSSIEVIEWPIFRVDFRKNIQNLFGKSLVKKARWTRATLRPGSSGFEQKQLSPYTADVNII